MIKAFTNKNLKIEHEINFHSYLYTMTQNETLKNFQTYLKIVFDYVLDIERSVNIEKIPITQVSHMDLVICLENGTVEEFRKLMGQHFEPYLTLDIFQNRSEFKK